MLQGLAPQRRCELANQRNGFGVIEGVGLGITMASWLQAVGEPKIKGKPLAHQAFLLQHAHMGPKPQISNNDPIAHSGRFWWVNWRAPLA